MKYCIECGCIMPDDHDGEMCEVCQAERGGTVPDCLRSRRSINDDIHLRYRGILRRLDRRLS